MQLILVNHHVNGIGYFNLDICLKYSFYSNYFSSQSLHFFKLKGGEITVSFLGPNISA